MKKITLILAFSFIASISTAQEKEMATPTPNYRQAAKYSPKNLGKLVHSTTVRPNWLENGKSLLVSIQDHRRFQLLYS